MFDLSAVTDGIFVFDRIMNKQEEYTRSVHFCEQDDLSVTNSDHPARYCEIAS